jgi:outer membrane protein, heavy metal efflux system
VTLQAQRPQCAVSVLLVAALVAGAATGCVRYRAKPLAAATVAADYEARSLAEPGLRTFLETNRMPGEWPRKAWDLEALTLAAFYFSPDLDVARAQWGMALAGSRTAGERPNPTVTASPQYATHRRSELGKWT